MRNQESERRRTGDHKSGMFSAFVGIFAVISALLLAAGTVVFFRANMSFYEAHLNSDVAAEGLLAEDIAENRMRVPDTWVGSSERRVFSTANLGSFFYLLTHNRNLSMGLSCSVYFLILLLCMAVFLRCVGFEWVSVLIVSTGAVFFTGSLESLGVYAVFAGYYDSYLCVMFLLFAMYAVCLSTGRVSARFWVLGIFLSVLAGLEGYHSFLMAFLPLAAAEALRTVVCLIRLLRSYLRYSVWSHQGHVSFSVPLWSFSLAILDYAVIHIFSSSSQQTSRNIRHAPEKFVSAVWPQMISAVSPGRNRALFLLILVVSVCGYVYIVSLERKGSSLSRENPSMRLVGGGMALICLPVSVLVLVCAGTFTTAESAERYYVVENFAIPIGCGIWLDLLLKKRKEAGTETVLQEIESERISRKVPGILSAVLLTIWSSLAIPQYQSLLFTETPPDYLEYQKGLSWMSEQGYDTAYATFDYADLLAGLSDQKITVGAIDDVSRMTALHWLTDERWYPPCKPEKQETVYAISEAKMADFQKFLESVGCPVLEEKIYGGLHFIILPENFLRWQS